MEPNQYDAVSSPTIRLEDQEENTADDMARPRASLQLNQDFVETEFDKMISSLQSDGYIVLHQTWKDTCVLETKVDHMKSWESIEDKIKVVFWTDETMDRWISIRFNGTSIQNGWEVLKTTDKAHIKKADVFRAMLIWYYGGIYADLDIQLRESFREFLEENRTTATWEPREAMERWSQYKSGMDFFDCFLVDDSLDYVVLFILTGDARKTFMLSGFLLSGHRYNNFIAFLVNSILSKHIDGNSSSQQYVLYATGPAAEADAYYSYIDHLDRHDIDLHVMTYREFSHYAEHHSGTSWLPESVQGIGCVEVSTIYANTTLVMGNP